MTEKTFYILDHKIRVEGPHLRFTTRCQPSLTIRIKTVLCGSVWKKRQKMYKQVYYTTSRIQSVIFCFIKVIRRNLNTLE